MFFSNDSALAHFYPQITQIPQIKTKICVIVRLSSRRSLWNLRIKPELLRFLSHLRQTFSNLRHIAHANHAGLNDFGVDAAQMKRFANS